MPCMQSAQLTPNPDNCTCSKQPYAKRNLAPPARGGDVIPNGAFDDGTMYRLAYVPKVWQPLGL